MLRCWPEKSGLSKTRDNLLAVAEELGRLLNVDADQQLVNHVVELQVKIDESRERSEAARDAKTKFEATKERHKKEIDAAWRKMRSAEHAARDSGERDRA